MPTTTFALGDLVAWQDTAGRRHEGRIDSVLSALEDAVVVDGNPIPVAGLELVAKRIHRRSSYRRFYVGDDVVVRATGACGIVAWTAHDRAEGQLVIVNFCDYVHNAVFARGLYAAADLNLT